MTFVIRATDVADAALRAAIVGPFIVYNEAKTGRNDSRPLILAIDDAEGGVIGGLWGRTSYDWLFVEVLFVPEALRGRGVGTELMKRAEDEALKRGCHSAWLGTHDFQAREFYERLGYSRFAELRDCPVGSVSYLMKKVLKQI